MKRNGKHQSVTTWRLSGKVRNDDRLVMRRSETLDPGIASHFTTPATPPHGNAMHNIESVVLPGHK